MDGWMDDMRGFNSTSVKSDNGFGWLVGFGLNGPLRQYFSLYRAVSQREKKRNDR